MINKKMMMMPVFILLILSITNLTGCIRVEMEGFEFDDGGKIVTLNGKAPTRDFLERILCNKDTRSTSNPSVEFRFYKNANEDYRNSYRTEDKDTVNLESEYAYFSAEIDDLNPNTKYHVRAFAYYMNIDPDGWESGWAYSTMFSFTPAELTSSKGSFEIDQIIPKEKINIEIIRILLEKNPRFK